MAKKRAQLPKRPLEKADQSARSDSEARACRLVEEGAQLLAAHRAEEALVRLERAWELDPQNAAAALNLGGAHILLGRHERAVPVLEAALDLEPNNAMIWTNLAAAHLGKLPFATAERREKAIAAFQRALALDPQAPNVHYNLGLVYVEEGKLDLARTHFSAALDANPNDRDALRYLEQLTCLRTSEDGNVQPS